MMAQIAAASSGAIPPSRIDAMNHANGTQSAPKPNRTRSQPIPFSTRPDRASFTPRSLLFASATATMKATPSAKATSKTKTNSPSTASLVLPVSQDRSFRSLTNGMKSAMTIPPTVTATKRMTVGSIMTATRPV